MGREYGGGAGGRGLHWPGRCQDSWVQLRGFAKGQLVFLMETVEPEISSSCTCLGKPAPSLPDGEGAFHSDLLPPSHVSQVGVGEGLLTFKKTQRFLPESLEGIVSLNSKSSPGHLAKCIWIFPHWRREDLQLSDPHRKGPLCSP